jgi:hypothetical protein
MRNVQDVQEPVPANASCAVCGRPRPRLAKRDGDLYCSTECCKRAQGVVTDERAVERLAAQILIRAMERQR